MTGQETNARRFLDAFADIETELMRQQAKQYAGKKRPTFFQLVANSKSLIPKHVDALESFGDLRNAISHDRYLSGAPIADPRIDTVEEIERLRELILRPPLLSYALRSHGKPKIFSLDDDIQEFLKLVTEEDFSQAPVDLGNNQYALITTNAIARWYARNYEEHGGLISSAAIEHVLGYAEAGDRVQKVRLETTTVEAINIFSGQASSKNVPPAALLVMDRPGLPPQSLAVRADLTVLYAQLGE